MLMACCLKEYAEECEILVCVNAPAPFNPGLYQRLRFGLLASSWLPSPLGIFVWSALHVMLLIVGGPVFWVLGLLTAFLFYSVCLFGAEFLLLVFWYPLFGFFAVTVDLVRLLVQAIRFCWSLVGFLACHEPIVEWRGGTRFTVLVWQEFKSEMKDMPWDYLSIGVPCMSDSLYERTRNRELKIWAWWCEEVVHRHDAIAL